MSSRWVTPPPYMNRAAIYVVCGSFLALTAWSWWGELDVVVTARGRMMSEFWGRVHFWLSLVLLGVAWNFMYIGGTTLLTETYRPEEKAKAQGANDFCVFAMMVMSSITSGLLVSRAGWGQVNLVALPLLAIVGMATVWLTLRKERSA